MVCLIINCKSKVKIKNKSILSNTTSTLFKYLNYIKRITLAVLLPGFLFASYASVSQNNSKIDSLGLLLKSSRDTTRFNILSELFKSTNRTDFEQALKYAQAAYDQAEAIGDSVRMVEGGRMIAYSLDDLGRNDEVVKTLNKVIKIAERNKLRYPALKSKSKFLYNNAAIAYMYLGKYDSSLSYHYKSLEIREMEDDLRGVGTAMNNIGLVYFKLRNIDKALDNYLRAYEIKNELKDFRDVEKILSNIGLCYNELGESAKAIESFNKALGNCKENCSKSVLEEVNFGLGRAYLRLKDFDKAMFFFNTSLKISRDQNDTEYVIENLIKLGIIERELKMFPSSITYLNEANGLAQGSGYAELLITIYKELSKTYKLISNFEAASAFQGQYIQLKDSIYGENLIKNLARVQTNYEQRENIKTIRLNTENIKLKDDQLKRQRLQYFFIVLVAILIILLALVLLWANRRQHVHNAALSEAKRVIEEQNKQLTITNEELDKRVQEKTQDLFDSNETLQNVNEELDNFVYRSSHDLRGPLVTIKGVCNVAMLDVKDQLAQDYLKRLDITAEKLNTILTRLLIVNQINHVEIQPSKIDFKEIVDGALAVASRQGIPPKMIIEQNIDATVSLTSDKNLIKIVFENLIENAIKFYNTSDRVTPYVRIKIGRSKLGRVQIIIEDNGIGVNTRDQNLIFHLFVRASERSENGGIGLYLTRLATQQLGGEVRLISSSESGSIFMVLLPTDINLIIEKRKDLEVQRLKEKERREKEMKRNQNNDEWTI